MLFVNIKNINLFERFITLLAGRVGQVVNFSALATETGVSSTTINNGFQFLKLHFFNAEYQSGREVEDEIVGV